MKMKFTAFISSLFIAGAMASSCHPDYPCCNDCEVYYQDNEGDWGIINKSWCFIDNTLCKKDNNNKNCKFEALGYKCCSQCDVYYTDDDGDWGVENNKWCGIPESCYDKDNKQPQENTTTGEPSVETDVINSFKPNKDNVKIFGRANYYEDGEYLWFGITAAGIEFKFTGKTVTIDVTADSSSTSNDNPARYAIYADNKLYVDSVISKEKSELTVEFDKSAEHIVRFIKLSESSNGTLRITDIKANTNKIVPTEPGKKKIEFIGDSITCGYGVDGTEGAFSTKTEDGSKTYAYKVAQKFNADFSLFAFSGFGIISGYTADGKRNTVSTLPQYYDKLGFSWYTQFGSDQTQISDVKWDFNEFVPDLIIINLGTNDGSYLNSVSGEENKQSERKAFAAEYEVFIGTVRDAYPEANILCTLGIMGQDLYPEIEEAVKNYKEKTGDEKVNAFEFNQQDINKNGKGIDWHPAPQSHVDAAYELIEEIENRYGWTSDPEVNIEVK